FPRFQTLALSISLESRFCSTKSRQQLKSAIISLLFCRLVRIQRRIPKNPSISQPSHGPDGKSNLQIMARSNEEIPHGSQPVDSEIYVVSDQ
ncbi:hypothetical protein LINGRAHAP2_LOCUS30330, partial [Linum grandiflorum]